MKARFTSVGGLSVLVAVALLAAGADRTLASPAASSALAVVAASSNLSLGTEQRAAETLVNKLPLDQALGPLAPVALSPFFALTCLSGASLLADSGILPDGIANNPLLGRGSALNNGLVFAALLGLTVITALPKFTKVTKPLGQAIDQLEAYSGIVAVVLVQFVSQLHLGGTEPDQVTQVVYQAGIFSATADTVMIVLVAAFSAVNIFVVNAVKYFFEFLVWLSPFPLVDAAFETANKAVAGFLVAVYVWSPGAATMLNLIIFALCLMIFAWAYRRAVYMRSVVGDPFFGWLGDSLFRRSGVTCTSARLSGSLGQRFPAASVVVKAFAGRGYQGIKRKARGYLIQSEGRAYFAALRFLRAPLVVTLPQNGAQTTVDQGLLSTTISFGSGEGEPGFSVLLTRRYNSVLGELIALLGAAGAVDAAVETKVGAMAASRQLGTALKAGKNQTLRAELA